MNPLISPTSSLFLPLDQLNQHCQSLLVSLQDSNTSQKDLLLCEQTLWNEVKKIQDLKDKTTFLYLIGFYHSLLFRIAPTSLTTSLNNQQFHYNILLRLGDLNAFMEQNDVAKYYHSNAEAFFPKCTQIIRKRTRNIALESILSINNKEFDKNN